MLLTKAELDLARLTPKGESRYMVNGIAVRERDTAATNGHWAVTVAHSAFADDDYPQTAGLEHATPNGTAALLHRDTALGALKALPKKTTIPVLACAALGKDSRVYVNTLDSVQTFGKEGGMGGQFPNIEAVIPKDDKPLAVVGLSAAYLRELADFIERHGAEDSRSGERRCVGVKLTIYGAERPVRFDAKTKDGQDVMALLMPVPLE